MNTGRKGNLCIVELYHVNTVGLFYFILVSLFRTVSGKLTDTTKLQRSGSVCLLERLNQIRKVARLKFEYDIRLP